MIQKFKQLIRRLKKGLELTTQMELIESHESELSSVSAGINKYQQTIKKPQQSSPLLRRNIHRLEKALCFPNRKPTFAAAYIQQTVEIYQRMLEVSNSCPQEMLWAEQVLTRFFNEVDSSDQKIQSAHSLYRDIEKNPSQHTICTPRSYSKVCDPTQISSEQFSKLCHSRVSCRWFTDKRVSDQQLHYCISMASQAASACNRQPFRFLHIKNDTLRKKVVNIPLGTKAFGDDLPELIMVLGDLSHFRFPRDRHLIFTDASLATAQFLLALVVQGLAGVPINWPDIHANHQKARKLLNLQEHEFPIMLIGFGHPKSDAQIPFSQKKNVSQLLSTYE